MDTPIRMPFYERHKGNLHIAKGPLPNGATTFGARSFVRSNGSAPNQILIPCATDATVCYGWCPDRSHLATENPPDALYRDPHAISGANNYLHWPFDPRNALFVMNITNASGAIGQANSAPQLLSVLIGTEYELYRDVTSGVQMLDVSATTNKFAKVVAIYPGQSLNDYNGLVLVELTCTLE